MANADDPVDPNLQRKLDLVQHLLIKGASTQVPFTTHLSESEEENYQAYQTSSQGPPSAPPKLIFFSLEFQGYRL